MNNYDVSIFIITKDNQYIPPCEYDKENDGDGVFICVMNEILNSEFGNNNSICIYKDWISEVKNAKNRLKQKYDIKFDSDDWKHVLCQWSKNDEYIPINERFVDNHQYNDIEYYTDQKNDNIMKYLDGYLSCQSIMSVVTSLLKGDEKKEEYIPAIMLAYNTVVHTNEQTYKGYLPSIGQLQYMHQNEIEINEALKKITRIRFPMNLLYFGAGTWWSSTQITWKQSINIWTMYKDSLIAINMCYKKGTIFPLFVV